MHRVLGMSLFDREEVGSETVVVVSVPTHRSEN